MTRIYAFLAGLAALFGSFLAFFLIGKKSAGAKQKIKTLETNAKAAKDAKDTRNELESQDDQYLVDILTGKLRGKR